MSSPPRPFVLQPSPHLAAHVAVAIRTHREMLRRQLDPIPQGLRELEDAFAGWAREGQNGTPLEPISPGGDGEPMTLLLLRPEEAAEALAVSERTVKRLLASGELPSVKVGEARRVHRDDLETYVESLRTREATPA